MNQLQFFALDLEFNQPSKRIIQVGLCLGARNESPENFQCLKWYVDPGEPISEPITALTGITDDDIRTHAIPLPQVALEIGEALKARGSFVNPVVWGDGDARSLLAAFAGNDVLFPFFGHRSIDVKTLYVYLNIVLGRNARGGLKSAMAQYKVKFEGEPHRADVDAFNTLRLFFALLDRQSALEDIRSKAQSI